MGFDFQRRSRRPPADAINAMLSFAYSLLTADLMSAIQTVGLDPYVGFFHQIKYGKPCLALDLMEEFRPIIADSVVITLINNRRIKPEDFTQSHGGWYLKAHRRKVFYAAYETRKNETITHPVFKYKLTFRRAMELQVRLLAKYLTGEIEAVYTVDNSLTPKPVRSMRKKKRLERQTGKEGVGVFTFPFFLPYMGCREIW